MQVGSLKDVVARYDGIHVEAIRSATGWSLAVADNIDVIAPPSAEELNGLRDLHERTRIAHGGCVISSRKKSTSVTIASQA
jgi:hypothetical protein